MLSCTSFLGFSIENELKSVKSIDRRHARRTSYRTPCAVAYKLQKSIGRHATPASLFKRQKPKRHIRALSLDIFIGCSYSRNANQPNGLAYTHCVRLSPVTSLIVQFLVFVPPNSLNDETRASFNKILGAIFKILF